MLQRMVSEIKDHQDHRPLKENCKGDSEPSPAGELIAVSIKEQPEKAQRRKPLAEDLVIYNFGATAADDQLILQPAETKESEIRNIPETEIKELFHDGGIDYYRTISSDRELAEALSQELRQRGIDLCPKQISDDVVLPAGARCPRPHHDRIFLLSEWDTAYGRYLPNSVSDTFGADDSSFTGCRLPKSHGIMHASYLRGRWAAAQPPRGKRGTTLGRSAREADLW